MNLLKKLSTNSEKKFNEIKKKIDINKDYTIKFKNINKDLKIIFVKDDEDILIGDFHFFGLYNPDTKIWKWANILSGISYQVMNYIDTLRLKSYIFEKKMNNSETDMFFYQFLTKDSMYIPSEKYVGFIVDLLLYLSDDLYLFQPSNSSGSIQFVGLTKINELYQ